jgi:hypothetical protein
MSLTPSAYCPTGVALASADRQLGIRAYLRCGVDATRITRLCNDLDYASFRANRQWRSVEYLPAS